MAGSSKLPNENPKAHEEQGLVRVVVIGKTGSGKSSLANALLGKKGRFKCGALASSLTTETEADEGYCKDIAVKVVDTPGFFDTNVGEKDTNTEIIRCFALSGKGPNLFIYCIEVGKFTNEEAESFRRVKMILGDCVTYYTVIVFTKRDQLEDLTEEKYKESAPPQLKNILQEVRSYFFINSKSANLETELDSLSAFIKTDVKTDSYYIYKKYIDGIKTLKRLVEVGRVYKEAYTQWVNKRKGIIDQLSKLESNLKAMIKKVRFAKIAGSGAGVLGSTIATVGLLAAPLTGGLSIILTATGAAIGVAGAASGSGATITDALITKKRRKEIDTLLEADGKLLNILRGEQDNFDQILSKLLKNNEIKCVIQHVLNKSITRANNEMFEEKVTEGFDVARDYLLQFLKIDGKPKESVEIHTGHAADVSLRTTSFVATTGGHALKSFAVATDATADVLGSITSSAAAAVKVTAIASVVVSAITLPIDLYTIIMNANDLHSNKNHELGTVLRDYVEDMEQNMEDYSKCRGILHIFADEVAKFTDSKIDY